MNRTATILIFLLLGIALGGITSYTLLKMNNNSSGKTYKKIALFAPAVHEAMDEIEQGFMDALQHNSALNYTFDFYNGNGNPTLIRGQAEEIVRQEYDLIFSIGSSCSKIVKELLAKKKSSVPLVFTAIDDPIALGLVPNLLASGTNVTGVTIASNYNEQIELLSFFKPNAKKVVLVYDPKQNSGSEDNKKQLEQALTRYGMELRSIEVESANEIPLKVPSLLSGMEVMILLTDHTVCSAADALVKLCNQYGITLYGSTLSLSTKGAVLTYGVEEKEHGIQAAAKAKQILENKLSPGIIAITPVKNYKVQINQAMLSLQKVSINPLLLKVFQAVLVVPYHDL